VVNVLDSSTPVLVTVEDPVWFEQLAQDWLDGKVSASLLLTGEREHQECLCGGHKIAQGHERLPEEQIAFIQYLRAHMHQEDLERASQPPVFNLSYTPPEGMPAASEPDEGPSGVIHVTRKARQLIENTGPQAVLRLEQSTAPMPAVSSGPATLPRIPAIGSILPAPITPQPVVDFQPVHGAPDAPADAPEPSQD
jgi:hypothetical protein